MEYPEVITVNEQWDSLDVESESGPPPVSDRYVAFEHESALVIFDRTEKTGWIKSDRAIARKRVR